MTIYRARVSVDLLYEADKPLTSALLTRITNRTGTYVRTGAVEGLEEDRKIKVVFDEAARHQHTHHHDARYEQCRVCLNAGRDELGSTE